MSNRGVDPLLVRAWLSGRSIARGLPQPVAEYGGYRVDSNTAVEVRRWVFPRICPGLGELAHTLSEPRHFIKLCGEADELRSALPDGWQLHAPNYFMQASADYAERSQPNGYATAVKRIGPIVEVRIVSYSGALAASGYAAETNESFIYDRIITAPEHRRKGLGRAVMAALRAARQNREGPELLVATKDGQALYSNLGWCTISPYSTASIVAR